MNKRQKKKKEIEKAIAEINRSLKVINKEILDLEIVESRNCLATNKEFSSIRKAIVDQQDLTQALAEALAELQDYVLNDLTNRRPIWPFWK
ncbi:hypothetical protein [Streptococcus uberis]|uniref:hypothetical protein n=1 Tax=Streptococcus uberis TaxID=1349 RepID=UPI001FF59D8E|nr:hypothetical protein [Streptococcus uberis]MCK1187795.1 hypothetical protein [Streptococcus uberis]